MVSPVPGIKILSVSELTRLIKTNLEDRFGTIWVEGEISNLKIPSSGHLYMTLKDESSQLRAVLFRNASRIIRFRPQDGQKVLCRGRLTVYEPRGDYQIILDYIEPRGLGALQAAFEQLKERLQKEGLFDPERKKPLPAVPRRIAVVTSPTGAAIQDFLKVIRRRFANINILVYPVPVQGEAASPAIAAALADLNGRPDIEVIVLARGGGSLEDLWAFNTEEVARAISSSAIPVISAVGHEVDYTISDFAADLRAPTPSAAAEMVVGTKKEFLDRIQNGLDRLKQLMSHRLEIMRGRLETQRRVIRDPRKLIEAHLIRLDEMEGRIVRAVRNLLGLRLQAFLRIRQELRHRNPVARLEFLLVETRNLQKGIRDQMRFFLDRKRNRLEQLISTLDSLSPLAILSRGYSITRTFPEKMLLKDARTARSGERVHVQLEKGALICRVEETRG